MQVRRGLTKRILLWLVAIAVIMFISARIYYALTDDFRMSNITHEMPYTSAWEIKQLSQDEELQLQKMLNQPYSYLGKGSQSYAFASADGNYVLKFFKFKHLRPSWFLDLLPPVGPIKTYQDKQTARKKRKLFGVFNSYKLAYDVDKEESGLIYIQLNMSGNSERHVILEDKLGLTYDVDLQGVPFVLQKRGVVLREVLDQLLQNNDLETAKQRIGQIFEMYAQEYSKGVFDHDHGVMRNVGFYQAQPFHLDVGKLLSDESMRQKAIARQDALLVVSKIKEWIHKNYPQHEEQLFSYIDLKMHALFD